MDVDVVGVAAARLTPTPRSRRLDAVEELADADRVDAAGRGEFGAASAFQFAQPGVIHGRDFWMAGDGEFGGGAQVGDGGVDGVEVLVAVRGKVGADERRVSGSNTRREGILAQ